MAQLYRMDGLPHFRLVRRECLPPLGSEWKTQREDPAVVVLVEFRHRNLHAGADGEAESLRDTE